MRTIAPVFLILAATTLTICAAPHAVADAQCHAGFCDAPTIDLLPPSIAPHPRVDADIVPDYGFRDSGSGIR